MNAEKQAEIRKVVVRDSRDDIAANASGLKAGDIVITDGILRLTPGASVRILDTGKDQSAASAAQGK